MGFLYKGDDMQDFLLKNKRIEKIFHDSQPTLTIENKTVKHSKCNNLLTLKIVYGVSSSSEFDIIYAAAYCDYCDIHSNFESNLIVAIESINQ